MNAVMGDLARANPAAILMADRSTHTTFTQVAQVRNIRGPEPQGEHSDATAHASGGWSELISTLKDGGRLVFDVVYTRADHAGLADAALEQTLEMFKLTFADGTGLQFSALVDVEFHLTVAGLNRAKVSLHLSGAVTKF